MAASGRRRSTPVQGRRRSPGSRAGRLRGHPERLGRQRLDRRGRGGTNGTANPHAKQPNSFVYRFVPNDPRDLTKGGKLQALQVESLAHGQPIAFHAGAGRRRHHVGRHEGPAHLRHSRSRRTGSRSTTPPPTAPRRSTPTRSPRRAGGTPFKRRRTAQFRPGTELHGVLLRPRPATPNAAPRPAPTYGGFGAVLKLDAGSPSARQRARCALFYRGDAAHAASTTSPSWRRDTVVVVEDAGDSAAHASATRSTPATCSTSTPTTPPGAPAGALSSPRAATPSATIDSALCAAAPGFQNDGDNEITGIHVSDGDPTAAACSAPRCPTAVPTDGWRRRSTPSSTATT